MAQAYLGDEIDLHAGGEDLIFPHHECEIAQAEVLTKRPFARHWVHTRFLQSGRAQNGQAPREFPYRERVGERSRRRTSSLTSCSD